MPQPTADEWTAINAWNLLSDESRGLDLGHGLDTVVELLGVQDVEALLHRLQVIKTHRPPERAKE